MFAQVKNATVLMLLSAFWPFASVHAATSEQKKAPPTVEVMPISRSTVTQTFTAIATLRANEAITLKAEVAGRVTAINFVEGQQVKKGQLLVTLDNDLLTAELATAQAGLDLAQAEFGRYQSLFKEQQLSALDYERKKAELAQAKAAMSLTLARLKQKEIHAPFSGIIGLRLFSLGDVVQANQSLVSLTSFSPLKADIKIPETSSGQIKLKQTITFAVDAIPDLILKGQVAAFESSLDSGTRAVIMRAMIPQSDRRVKAGMTARATIQLQSTNDIVIPEQALVAQKGKFVVFILKGKEVTATPVTVGQRQTGTVAILSGLHDGDVVVVSGQNKLPKPKMTINPVPMQGGR